MSRAHDPEDPELPALRRRMDALNRRLSAALQQRARLVRAIAACKRRLGLPAADPVREQQMLARVLADPGDGFDRDSLRRIWDAVLDESRRLAAGGRD